MLRPKIGKCLRTNALTLLTVSGVIIGIIVGLVLREIRSSTVADGPLFTSREIAYIGFIGDLFLRMLKALILPLIISSLVSAVGGLNLRLSGRIGGRAIVYYLVTTVIAVILGIILVIAIKPGRIGKTTAVDGEAVEEDEEEQESGASSGVTTRNVTTADTLLDLVRNMFPPNLVQACTAQYQTVLVPPKSSPEQDLSEWTVSGEYTDGMNILGLVVASCVLGVAMSSAKDSSRTILKCFQETSEIMMRITGWVIWLSPVGVLFLIAAKLIEMDDLSQLAGQLGFYFLTVLVGILFHGCVILPAIYYLFVRKNPYRFLANMGQAIATAFGTSSSSATLPITIKCLEENNKIDERVSRFVLPIGATINMDGTALYEAVAAIFIAQMRDMNLSFGNILAISITATAASIGAAGIPQAGLVTMVMVLDTIGLPAEDVSLIIAVDWLLDRVRTVINILGDSFGAGIVAHLSREELMSKSADDTDRHSNLAQHENEQDQELHTQVAVPMEK